MKEVEAVAWYWYVLAILAIYNIGFLSGVWWGMRKSAPELSFPAAQRYLSGARRQARSLRAS